ncbi:MSMEG_4193 family putative phosphomutase [Paenibacillus sp. TRM 82003]|uniref:histidine phosphatase family protein n=1 Tax=Kineococcus sp. TRM81007 TaxID=2925831 RepID=UPI001F59D6F0|nr:histidine phosphatase family protein [Kineococcus sp. TRM81007]MCI2237689.1 MSMEG_4193 family putative phosphomutase [Kineococcus sp. TRM81007]MCI3921707.1 MSMEG_4193 family putative phosphomutase [Paenibacillus sp. TRM 82003]
MPTLLLVRHGRTTANTAGVLAGWTPGVRLDEHGEQQATALAQRLAPLPLAAVVTSPLERCRQTAELLRAVPGPDGERPGALVEERLGEVRYGDWTGRELKTLAREPLWKTVQAHPSAAVFPGADGEGLAHMQHRAVAAVREHDARVAAEHGEDAVWMAVTHGDVVKALLADALGMHLDLFQRLSADPCSVSVVRYAPLRPFVLRTNDSGGDLAALAPRRKGRRRAAGARGAASSDAVVGGATGT